MPTSKEVGERTIKVLDEFRRLAEQDPAAFAQAVQFWCHEARQNAIPGFTKAMQSLDQAMKNAPQRPKREAPTQEIPSTLREMVEE